MHINAQNLELEIIDSNKLSHISDESLFNFDDIRYNRIRLLLKSVSQLNAELIFYNNIVHEEESKV
jgi:hypothetical protein